MQRHTTHYAAYDAYWEQTTPVIVGWFDRYVRPAHLIHRSSPSPAIGESVTTESVPAESVSKEEVAR